MSGLRVVTSGPLSRASITEWRALVAHAAGCADCAAVVLALLQVPDDPYPLYERCCAEGQPLYGAWTDAKLVLVEHLKAINRARNMAGLDQADADRRAAALASLPARAFSAIMGIEDDEEREARIRAVEAAYDRHGTATVPEPQEMRECAREGCEVRFVPDPRFTFQKYCSERCRKSAHRQMTRGGIRLESTDPE